jgi:hypothetical protein
MTRLLFLTTFVAVASAAASAQTTGTASVSGSVAKSASIRWWSFQALNSETGANAPNTQNSPLVFTVNMGDVSPSNTNAYAGGKVKVILRSNAAYTLSAQVTASSGFGSGANGDLTLSDVGFGLADLANSGPLVLSDPAANSTIAGSFNNDPSAAAKNSDGVPSFSASLNNLSSPTQVLSGPRISKAGDNSSSNNGLLVNTIFAVAPQFYTPTTFSATVTFTIATP